MNPRAALGVAMGSAALATASITATGQWEGLELTAYPDRLARNIPTACYGETLGIKLGMTFTKPECDDKLASALLRHWNGIEACYPAIKDLPGGQKIAHLDLSYNIGINAWCRSSIPKLLAQGEQMGACSKTLQFTMSMGKWIRGLFNRRTFFIDYCEGRLWRPD